MRPEGSLPFSQ